MSTYHGKRTFEHKDRVNVSMLGHFHVGYNITAFKQNTFKYNKKKLNMKPQCIYIVTCQNLQCQRGEVSIKPPHEGPQLPKALAYKWTSLSTTRSLQPAKLTKHRTGVSEPDYMRHD